MDRGMSFHLILAVMVIYAYVAVDQAAKGHWPGVIVWGAYAVANLGLAMMAK